MTGAELADLSADARQLVYGGSGGEWLRAWWLLPLAAVAALVIAILEIRTATIQARNVLAAALVGIGATVTVGLIATFSYLARKSDIATSVVGPGLMIDRGFWLTAMGTLSIAAGGVVMYNHHPRTAAEPATDQPTLRDWIVETHSAAGGSPMGPDAGNKPVTSFGSGHQQSEFGPYRLEWLIATALVTAIAATAYVVYVLKPSNVDAGHAGTGVAPLVLSKRQVKIGDTYYANVSGFSPGEKVRFSWTGPTNGGMGDSFFTDSSGSGSHRVFERDPPGNYTITVTGLTSGRTASAELQVVTSTDTDEVRLVLSKTQVKIGDTYYANAWGFSPGEKVRFSWTDPTNGVIGDFPATSGGSASIGVLERAFPGDYTITVTGLTSGRTASAELQVVSG
ncbi:MAG: hypothetical protein JO115_06105 [Pseudonocardiales bacterium]|nr:hypothetical protein [Pseudonocardiales bacterium]